MIFIMLAVFVAFAVLTLYGHGCSASFDLALPEGIQLQWQSIDIQPRRDCVVGGQPRCISSSTTIKNQDPTDNLSFGNLWGVLSGVGPAGSVFVGQVLTGGVAVTRIPAASAPLYSSQV